MLSYVGIVPFSTKPCLAKPELFVHKPYIHDGFPRLGEEHRGAERDRADDRARGRDDARGVGRAAARSARSAGSRRRGRNRADAAAHEAIVGELCTHTSTPVRCCVSYASTYRLLVRADRERG